MPPLSAVITSTSTHDIKVVTDVIDAAVIKRPTAFPSTTKGRRKPCQHLCLDRAYNSKSVGREIIKRDYVSYIHYKRKIGQKKDGAYQKRDVLCKK